MTEADPELEQAIARCVKRFYDKGAEDPLLGPVFASSIPDLEGHLQIVIDFWSRALLGTNRYDGHPYPPHVALPIEPGHFERWGELFEESCRESLPPEKAEEAIAKAKHMSVCFQAGMFPFRLPDGRMSRTPA
jgi:hemoglobin